MSKKIIYISDFTLNQFNSVRDILYNIISNKDMSYYEQIIVKSTGRIHNPIKIDNYEGFKTYSTSSQKLLKFLKRKDVSAHDKAQHIFHKILYTIACRLNLERKYRIIESYDYLNTVLKKEKPDLVVFLIYSPNKKYAKLCMKYKIPYISILYDTYLGRPKVNPDDAYPLEKFVIENSEGYYVPSFFYDIYSKTYNHPKLHSMDLPLLIEENDVVEAYNKSELKYNFTYFGHMQAFRNCDTVKNILRSLNISMDVFSTEKYASDDTFTIHPAVTKTELYNIVAGSNYLIALDNSFPFQNYLPSKVYLYVSFTKPIIVFGDNEDSALKRFLDDYPWFYYQNINQSTEGLIAFLKNYKSHGFDKTQYLNYAKYLPTIALEPLINNIKQITEEYIPTEK